jgi:predicted ATPase/DNA-binding winged helix-turn-helix (wHTH) protein
MQDCLSFGDFTIDRGDERLLGPQGPVRLGNKAFRVLLQLAQQEGRLLTKDALFSSVWDGTIVGESALTSVIKELRRALGDESRTPRYIESIYGRGYRLLPEVRHGPGPAVRAEPEAGEPAPGARGAPLGRAPLLYIPAFDDSAVHESQPHLAAAVREEILFALSRFRDVRLVSDAATSTAPTAGGYGERDYQLSIKLLHNAASVRAFARLCHLATQGIIWAENMDLADGSLGPHVDNLVRRIAAAALPRLHDDLLSHLADQPQDVYDLYFLTKLKMRGQETFADAQEVAAAWERLIEQHPNFAPAYPPLTRLYNTDYCYLGLGSTGEKERRRAYELAHKAFAIDPTESHLQTVKGWSHLWAGESALARQHLDEALHLNPYNQSRLVEVATAFMYLDDLDAAADLLERCRNLTPFATEAPHEEQGLLHLLRGEFDLAAEQMALVRRHHPDDRAGTKMSIKGELYALLAAAGLEAPDLPARLRHWRDVMEERWSSPQPLNDERIKQWFLFHNPFQDPARRDGILRLLERALGGGREAPPRAPADTASAAPEPAPAAHPTNLPARRGLLVGRDAAMVELAALSTSHRLLTLCGAGGLGKTRLAMELGRNLLARFPDGAWFAALDRLADPGLLPEALLTMFGIRSTGERPPIEELTHLVRRKTMLLILDNAEHLLGAVAELVAELLDDAPKLTIVVTSREPLALADEQVWRVPALALPDMDDVAAVQAAPAAQLLIERIAGTMGSWQLPEADAATIAAICRQLDGSPLAIELVAPRFAHMTPQEVFAGIDDRFRLLGRGSRAAPERQQTLHATFDWSYGLLAESERTLLRRLAVFSGGWTLEAAEQVTDGGPLARAEILDALAALVDKSLVVAETTPTGSRYRLLETTRAYAAEKLREAGEADEFAGRHARFYRETAGRAHDSFETTPGNRWRATYVPELDNFRAAMRWAFAADGEAEVGIALAAHCGHLLVGQGLLREARHWVDLAAERLSKATPPGIAAFIHMGQAFTFAAGATALAKSAEKGVALARTSGGPLVLARTLNILGVSLLYAAPAKAEAALSEAVSLGGQFGQSKTLANSLMLRALLTQLRGDHDAAERDRSRSIEMMTALEDLISLPLVLGHQVEGRIEVGDLAGATDAARQAVEARQSWQAQVRSAHATNQHAACLLLAGETRAGRRRAEQALAEAADAGQERARMLAIQSLALAACRDNAPEAAARLLGFVDAACAHLPLRLPSELAVHRLLRAEVEAALPAKARKALEAAGAQLTLEEAAALARESVASSDEARPSG